jgi:hypothetical protein
MRQRLGVHMSSTDVERPAVELEPPVVDLEPGDSERFSHYAKKEDITRAYIEGTPVIALCGKVWVPNRDPSRFPLCPECKRLFGLGPNGRMREWADRR